MKNTIVIPILCFSVSVSFAQQQPPKALLEIVKENKAGKIRQPVGISGKIILSAPKARLLAVTSKGKIYALPLDNTPCFVPNNSTVIAMPAKGWPPCKSGLMPNAFKMHSIIPVK
jgi:hypothetical protein